MGETTEAALKLIMGQLAALTETNRAVVDRIALLKEKAVKVEPTNVEQDSSSASTQQVPVQTEVTVQTTSREKALAL